jgi:hypothetical protein
MAQPTWAFRPEGEIGESPVLHRRAVARRPSPAGRWQGAGEDVDEEHAHTTGVRIWGLGGRGAHRRGLEAVRDSVERKTSTTALTTGH